MRNDILYGIGMLLAASGVQAHDGRVYVSGTITDNTCSLSPGSENINVAMGAVSQRQFYRAGDGSAWQPFAIDLQNCGSTASGVTVSFSGAADSRNTDLLALTAGESDASGIGIALYATGKVEGALTEHDVYTLAQHYLTPTQLAAVKEAQSSGAVHDALLTNQALAQHMDFSGTPAFVVMPQTQNGDVKRVTVIPGSTTQDMLQMAIQKAKG